MLLSAMEKGHFPFKKGTFSHHLKSWGARAPSPPPLPTPLFVSDLKITFKNIFSGTESSSERTENLLILNLVCSTNRQFIK